MGRTALTATLLGTAFAAAIAAATPAYAIDPGCYPADTVRAATWNATGPEKQFSIIVGDRNTDTRNKNFFTSSADGSVGYNIENNGTGVDDGKLCIKAKYMDVRVNTQSARPAWANLPKGSENERYITAQEARNQVRIIFGATTVVRRGAQEYPGPQILVTKADKPVEGMVAGGVITNDRAGGGDGLAVLVNLKTNTNFDALAAVQKPVQTAANSYAVR